MPCYQIHVKVYSWKYWNRHAFLTVEIRDSKYNISDLDYEIVGFQDKQARVSNEIMKWLILTLILREF